MSKIIVVTKVEDLVKWEKGFRTHVSNASSLINYGIL
jgi:hypothetical protein